MSLLSWLKQNTARDDAWITVHPNAGGKGSPVLLDDEGYIKGGMGGKFTGQRIDLMPRKSGYGVPASENDPLNKSTPGFLRTSRYTLKAPGSPPPGQAQKAAVTSKSEEPPGPPVLSENLGGAVTWGAEKELKEINGMRAYLGFKSPAVIKSVNEAKENYIRAVNKADEVIKQSNAPEDEKAEMMFLAMDLAKQQAYKKLSKDFPRNSTALSTKFTEGEIAINGAVLKAFYDHQEGTLKEFPSTLAGVSRGAPMSHEEADELKANPDGGHLNCQTCVAAYEMRRRGYNVKAQGPRKLGSPMDTLARGANKAWVDPKTGMPPRLVNISSTDSQGFADELSNKINPGERYHLLVGWKSSPGGHVITATKSANGEIAIFDPQNGKTVTGIKGIAKEYGDRIKLGASSDNPPKIYRVDNCYPNEGVMNTVFAKGG